MKTSRGFSLLELAIAMAVMTVLISGLLAAITVQVQIRRLEEARAQLDIARSAILGFAAANGRLPCPASAGSRGLESFCSAETGSCKGTETTDPQAHGNCSNFYDGFLPAASLGLDPLDEDGFMRDPWGGPNSRIRYAVHDATINNIGHTLTGVGRMRQASMSSMVGTGTPITYLSICATVSSSASKTSCGSGPNAKLIASNIPMIIYSLGPNANQESGGKSASETENLDGDRVFVSRTPSSGTDEFDDLVTWLSLNLIFDRLMKAGHLP